MALKIAATVDDLARWDGVGKAELVDGEIRMTSPAGGLHSSVAAEIDSSRRAHARATKNGRAFTDDAGFLVDLPNRKSFSPDVAYYYGPETTQFLRGAPAFAVEVRSPSDDGPAAEKDLAAKRADYFAAGTLVVWDVDLIGVDVVRAYQAAAPVAFVVFRRGELAQAEPAVASWSMPVDAFWE